MSDSPGQGPGDGAEVTGPDLAHAALERAKESARDAKRAQLLPSEEQRLAAAATRAERRRNRVRKGPREGADPVAFGTAINELLAARGWQAPVQAAGVISRWPELVGPDIAAHCAPSSFTDGELVLAAESTAWATQLRLMAPTLLSKINGELGAGAVKSVRVHGPTRAKKPGEWRVSGGRGERDTYG